MVEWRTDTGGSLTLEYVVDQPQGTIDRKFDWEVVENESVPTAELGTYRVIPSRSGKVKEGKTRERNSGGGRTRR